MAVFFSHFTPLEFHLEETTQMYHMRCESILFNDVKQGDPLPYYTCEVKMDMSGNYTVTDVIQET